MVRAFVPLFGLTNALGKISDSGFKILVLFPSYCFKIFHNFSISFFQLCAVPFIDIFFKIVRVFFSQFVLELINLFKVCFIDQLFNLKLIGGLKIHQIFATVQNRLPTKLRLLIAVQNRLPPFTVFQDSTQS